MVTAVNAQSHRQGGRGQGQAAGDGHNGMNRHAALDLTEEQQTEITTLRTAHYKAITPLKHKMIELKARERTLLSEESADMKLQQRRQFARRDGPVGIDFWDHERQVFFISTSRVLPLRNP
jgi:hypothetical protein